MCFVRMSMKVWNSSVLVFLIYVILNAVGSKLKRPRGVSIAKASLYPFSDNFVCFDGSATVSFENINDNYCDCADGSDEPGTSACPNGTFDCNNIGFQSTSIPSSRVNDGICDCCDGSDEYSSRVHCVNRCFEIAKHLRDEVERIQRRQQSLNELYQEYGRKGQELKNEKRQKMETLTKQKQELEQVHAQLKTLKFEAEKRVQEALELHTMLSQELLEGETCTAESTSSSETGSSGVIKTLSAEHSSSVEEGGKEGGSTSSEDVSATDVGEAVKQTAETVEDMQAVKQTEEITDDEALMQTAEIRTESAEAVKQMAETGDDAQTVELSDSGTVKHTVEVVEKQAVTQTEEVVNKRAVTQTEERREKQQTVQYSEETLQVIEAAKKAREQLNVVSIKLLNIIGEMHHCQRFLATDFGPAAEFATVSLRCYEFSDASYVYSLCPFDRVTQRSQSTGLSVMLGKWSQWSSSEEQKYRLMQYQHGDKCADNSHRSATVLVECGLTDAVTAATESTMCHYELMFTSPAACSQPPVAPSTDPVYDEL